MTRHSNATVQTVKQDRLLAELKASRGLPEKVD